MLMIVFGAGCLLLPVLFHAASLLHLGLPLLYALIVVSRLVLQPLRAGEWDLVCTHCPGTDFVGRVAGAESPQYYPITSFT